MSNGNACLMVELFLRRGVREEHIAPFMGAFPIYDDLLEAIDGMGVSDRVDAVFQGGSLWLVRKAA